MVIVLFSQAYFGNVRNQVDATARRQAHYTQILKKNEFVQGLSNPSLFVHVDKDVRLLLHGDNFMVAITTRVEKWFESVLFAKNDGLGTDKLH